MNLMELVRLRAEAEATRVEGMNTDSWPCVVHRYRDALQEAALELFEAKAILDELEQMNTEVRLEARFGKDGVLERTVRVKAWSPTTFLALDVAKRRSAQKLLQLLSSSAGVP